MGEPSSGDITSGHRSTDTRYVLVEPDPFAGAAKEYAETGVPWDERARSVNTLQLSSIGEQVWDPETGRWENVANHNVLSYDQAIAKRAPDGSGDNLIWVRPFNGLIPKEGTAAYMIIMDEEGNMIPMTTGSPGSPTTTYYTDFSVIGVNQHRKEIRQILTTFGEPFVFFFGETPRLVEFRGTLIDSENYDWCNAFVENYNLRLRGTKLAEMKARLYVGWNDFLIHGYGLSLQLSERASHTSQVMFSFAMLVVGEVRIGSGVSTPSVREFQDSLDSALKTLSSIHMPLPGADTLVGAVTKGVGSFLGWGSGDGTETEEAFASPQTATKVKAKRKKRSKIKPKEEVVEPEVDDDPDYGPCYLVEEEELYDEFTLDYYMNM